MQRPTGVTILAILAFIGAGMLVLAALAMFAGGAILSRFANIPQVGMVAGVAGAILAVMFLGFAVLEFVIGLGLWKLQNWARILTIVLICLALLSSALGILMGLTHMLGMFFFMLFFRRIIIAAIQVWILIYLLKPHVKQAFGATGL
jgi:uncharacterized membrane protein (DUF2068 family)